MRPESIASSRNPLLREIRRAAMRGSLTEDGLCVAESFHLLEEALRSECEVRVVISSEEVREPVFQHLRGLNSIRAISVPTAVFRELSTTENSQGVIALIKPPSWTIEHVLRGQSLVALLDGVQDPGNAGTIIRSAEAFGATGVICLKNTVSLFNPKCLRAAAGSMFRLPCVIAPEDDLLRLAFRQRGVKLYAASPKARQRMDQTDFKGKAAIVVGNEGKGVSGGWQRVATGVRIPTVGVESLNAAVAASVLLYEAHRQRMSQDGPV